MRLELLWREDSKRGAGLAASEREERGARAAWAGGKLGLGAGLGEWREAGVGVGRTGLAAAAHGPRPRWGEGRRRGRGAGPAKKRPEERGRGLEAFPFYFQKLLKLFFKWGFESF